MENKRKSGGEVGEVGGWVQVELWGEGEREARGEPGGAGSGPDGGEEQRPLETWCGGGAGRLAGPLCMWNRTRQKPGQTLALEACTPGSESHSCEQSATFQGAQKHHRRNDSL